MFPGQSTLTRGYKDTADHIAQDKPLEIGSKVWMLQPNKHKATAWFNQNGNVVPTGNHLFGHREKAPLSNYVMYNGADETTQAVTGLVFKAGAGARLTTGSRIYFPDIKEIIRLDADMLNTTTSVAVSRNFGRGVATTSLLKKGMIGLIISPAFEQGFTMGKGLTGTKVYKSFTTGIVSYPVQVVNTERAEANYDGDPFIEAIGDSWMQAADQVEADLLFGGAVNDETTYSHPMSTSEGIDNFISTNVFSGTKMSRMDFFDVLTEWQKYNKQGGAIMCSLNFLGLASSWAMSQTSYTIPLDSVVSNGNLGLAVNRVTWTVGTFDLIDIDLLNEHEALTGTIFFCPKNRYAYRPLIGNGQNLDIKYNPVSRDEIHASEGEIYGEVGHEFMLEVEWAKWTGLQF